jgi:hypothetical protein
VVRTLQAEAVTTVAHPAFPEGVPCCARCAYFAEHGEFPKAGVGVGDDSSPRALAKWRLREYPGEAAAKRAVADGKWEEA